MRKRNPKEILKFRADPVLRRAIKLRAALDDVDLQDVVIEALRKGLGAEIEEVQRRGLVDPPGPAAAQTRQPRKRPPGTRTRDTAPPRRA